MERKVRQYSEEFKQGAVQLALQSDSVSAVAHDLVMPEATLHTWAHKARNQRVDSNLKCGKRVIFPRFQGHMSFIIK